MNVEVKLVTAPVDVLHFRTMSILTLYRRLNLQNPVRFGDLRRLSPIGRNWGYERGLPVRCIGPVGDFPDRNTRGRRSFTVLKRYLQSPFTDPLFKKSSNGDSISALDGVRALAVGIVFASHSDAFELRGQGVIGVFLFFILSGFVLTLPYVRNPKRMANRAAIAAFFVNRALRIVPALTAAVLMLALTHHEGWQWILTNLSFYSGWNHLWSVAEEARFYLLFPLAVIIVALIPAQRGQFLALATMIVIAWTLQSFASVSEMNGRRVPFFLFFFLSGILACFIYDAVRDWRALKGTATVRLGGGVAIAVLLAIVALAAPVFEAAWQRLFQSPPGINLDEWHQPELWCAMLTVFLLSVAAIPTTLVGTWMRSSPMRHLGLLSYGLYLFHWQVLEWWSVYGLHGIPLFVAICASTYPIALISYLAIEKPFLMMKWKPQKQH